MTSLPDNGRAAPPLRIGVMVDGPVLPRWTVAVLRQISDAPHTELCLFVVNSEPSTQRSLLARVWNSRRTLLYELYERLDDLSVGNRGDAWALVDATRQSSALPVLATSPLSAGRLEHRLDAHSVSAVRD